MDTPESPKIESEKEEKRDRQKGHLTQYGESERYEIEEIDRGDSERRVESEKERGRGREREREREREHAKVWRQHRNMKLNEGFDCKPGIQFYPISGAAIELKKREVQDIGIKSSS